MEKFRINLEEIKVAGRDLVEKVKQLVHEANVHRLIIKNEQGHTLIEVPVSVACVGAIAAMVTNCTIIVERREPETPKAPESEKAAS